MNAPELKIAETGTGTGRSHRVTSSEGWAVCKIAAQWADEIIYTHPDGRYAVIECQTGRGDFGGGGVTLNDCSWRWNGAGAANTVVDCADRPLIVRRVQAALEFLEWEVCPFPLDISAGLHVVGPQKIAYEECTAELVNPQTIRFTVAGESIDLALSPDESGDLSLSRDEMQRLADHSRLVPSTASLQVPKSEIASTFFRLALTRFRTGQAAG